MKKSMHNTANPPLPHVPVEVKKGYPQEKAPPTTPPPGDTGAERDSLYEDMTIPVEKRRQNAVPLKN